MARMPGAVWQGEHGSILMARYDIVCVHTIVGYAPAHAAHFSTKADGTIIQSRDTKYQSGANLDGNYRVIAIENEDHGSAFGAWSGSNVPALTAAQVSANAAILKWAHETHGVPLQLCPNSRPESRGLAYHRQGIDGNFSTYPGRVSGGEVWSSSFGKVCPGDRRIEQRPEILAQAQGEDDVTPDEVFEQCQRALRYMTRDIQGVGGGSEADAVWARYVYDAARESLADSDITPAMITDAVAASAPQLAAAVAEEIGDDLEVVIDPAQIEAACERAVRTVFADAATD